MEWNCPKPAPDFNRLLTVLNRETPDRPVIFEFIMNTGLCERLSRQAIIDEPNLIKKMQGYITAAHTIGFDFAMIPSWETNMLSFKAAEKKQVSSVSLNEGCDIVDEASFNLYPWPEVREENYAFLESLTPLVPEGMKLMTMGHFGVLETAIDLVGFERLCMMSVENPDLTQAIFDAIGSRLVQHYALCTQFDCIGAMMGNDDWGFKTQTMFSPAAMDQYVFPYHQKIVEVVHQTGKPVILHSCGYLEDVMPDVIDTIGYDGKHSYEDTIVPVEEAYQKWHDRIAIVGGIDMDFLARSEPEAIYKRSQAMIEKTGGKGYALGSGNSIAEFIPDVNAHAMFKACWDLW